MVQRLFVGEQGALQDRRGRGRIDVLTEGLHRRRRNSVLLQQLSQRIDGTVAFENGQMIGDDRRGYAQQPGQAGRPVHRPVRAAEVGVVAVVPGLGLGDGEGGKVCGARVMADELRGGVPQRTLLQFRCHLTDGMARRDDRVVGPGRRIGPVGGHGLFVDDDRLTDPAQVHGIADQGVLRRHHHLRATAVAVARGAILGLFVDVGLLGGLGHPDVHAALGLHRLRHRDVDTALALPVDHQDLALLTSFVENLLQLGFPVRTPADDPLGIDRFDRLSGHSCAHQCLDLPGDQIVAVTQDLLEPALASGPHLVRVFGDRAQFGMGALDHIMLSLHQPMCLRPCDLVGLLQTVDLLQYRVQVGEGAGCTGHFIEEGFGSDAVDFDRIDAFGGLRVRAHHDPMRLGLLSSGLGRPELLGFDRLGETRLARFRAPP
ncbi:hypothetical protein B7C42_06063 [Nocardia cerradoensis]|uniref:Uncharacterized protein n=1 Tax=Nocardia cerradoensis TaxID=85688 RepID=A0A231GYW9_9NOCA|nr:hypothetical protein B7C42_06063 [Nocardia cerradoensis]